MSKTLADEMKIKGSVKIEQLSEKEHRVTWSVAGALFCEHGSTRDEAIDKAIDRARAWASRNGKSDAHLGLGVKPKTEAPSLEAIEEASG